MTSLRGMLIAWVLLPVAMVLTLPVVLIFSSVESMLEARLEKEIELVARSLRLPVEGALRSGDRQRLHEALGAVAEIGQVYGAAVYDAAGRRIAVAGEAIPGPAEQLQAVELVAIGEQVGLYDDFAGRAVYSYFVPLSTSLGRIDALLQVVREESEIRSRLAVMRRTGIAVALIGLGLIFGVVMIGHRMALTRPVQRLLKDMRNIGRGERSRRARIGPPKELAQVAGGLNQMLDALDQA
ncbi:MAG: HAMP domain-containing protein, partial [Wenzhouxiangellaceae bacterium]